LKHCSGLELVCVTLCRRALPNLWALIKGFPLKIELCEPTFKDMVVLYRRSDLKKTKKRWFAKRPKKHVAKVEKVDLEEKQKVCRCGL
jgi:hypothetical protein